MAGDAFNPVPLGQAGTGAAYLLPKSDALASANDWIDQQVDERNKAEALKKQQALDTAKAWQQNRLDIKAGRLWQPEINQAANEVTEMGMDLQRKGINPNSFYNDPKKDDAIDAYQKKRSNVMQMAQLRDQYTKILDEHDKLRSAQPDGFFENPDAEHQFMGMKLQDIMDNGYQVPDLKKAFNLSDKEKLLKPVEITTSGVKDGVKTTLVLPNHDAHVEQAHSLLQLDNETRAWAEKQIGMPLTSLPSTTDVPTLKNQLDQYYRSQPNTGKLAQMGISSYSDPKYDALITQQATKLAGARSQYDQLADGIAGRLDNLVNKKNEKEWDLKYQEYQLSAGRYAIEKARWLAEQQNDPGTTTLGDAGGFVPVVYGQQTSDNKQAVDENGKPLAGTTHLEKSSAVFSTKLPSVDVTLQPSTITSFDNKTGGRTNKNAEPISMKVSGIKMVAVWKGKDDNDNQRNTQLSDRQLQEVINGKWKGKTASDITFRPMVFGLQDKKDANNVHKVNTPISIPYEDFTGGNTKKVNTTGFDQYYYEFQNLQNSDNFKKLNPVQKVKLVYNPKFMSLPPDQKEAFLEQYLKNK